MRATAERQFVSGQHSPIHSSAPPERHYDSRRGMRDWSGTAPRGGQSRVSNVSCCVKLFKIAHTELDATISPVGGCGHQGQLPSLPHAE